MTQLQFYKYATLGLFLLNLAILGFFILTRPNHNRPPQRDQGFKEKAVHMLQLNDDQTLMFNKFAQEHNEEIGRISNAQSNKLNSFVSGAQTSLNEEITEAFIAELMQSEELKIRATFDHFKDIQSILNEHQKAEFQNFVREVMKLILFPDKKRPPRPKEF